MTSATFLGTGNFLVPPGRYWNSFVLDGRVLVEPSPTALPHLRRCGLAAADLDVVVISHFHPDHTFGWPFLLFEVVRLRAADRPFFVVGPPGVEAFLVDMMALGGVTEILDAARRRLDVRFVEVDGGWQDAGSLRFRAIEVDHVPHLRCFGYVFDRGDRLVGYSGDVRPCPGLDLLAAACDVVVLECNGPHPPPVTHMDIESVQALRSRFPAVRFVLTHLGEGVDAAAVAAGLVNVVVPADFETVDL
jgi:ribonuclease BN (tRNA processing enzyme)